jgi:hypothetical protein
MFRAGEPIYVAARVNQCRYVLVDPWGGIIEQNTQSASAAATAVQTESKVLVGCSFLRRFSS